MENRTGELQKIGTALGEERALIGRTEFDEPIGIRVSPNSYFIALLMGSFFSALLFYLTFDLAAIVVFSIAWVLVPFFALNDKIVFDGKRLSRSGPVPRIWAWLNGSRRRLRISDIELIETQAIRTLKRGGNIYYRYRTVIRGKGQQIVFASGGEDYRRMIRHLLPMVPEHSLDNRSLDLRDHLVDPKEALMKAEFEHIPSAEMLRSEVKLRRNNSERTNGSTEDHQTRERSEYLRILGNELRVNGYLLQALEALRRALVLRSGNARALFDYGRALRSFASVERSPRLDRRATAAMKLAEKRAGDDGELLSRLGESYFEAGEWARASRAFQMAGDRTGEGFRSARGLAELALRDGKIAHVIHQFSTANRLAQTASLRRWAKGEVDYFGNLNRDEEYLEMEISRVKLIESLERSKRTSLLIALVGFPVIFAGMLFEDDLVANIGWAVSTISLVIWTGVNISLRMLATRIPYHLMANDED